MKPEMPLASDGKNAIAENLALLLSAHQLIEIVRIEKLLKIDANEESKKLFQVDFEWLSKSGAEDLINHLKSLSPDKNLINDYLLPLEK